MYRRPPTSTRTDTLFPNTTSVRSQVRRDLALGLDHEAQVPAVAAQAGHQADGVAAGVPDRVEQAGAAVEFAQAVGAPGQVVGFLLGRFEQVPAGGRVAG